MSFKLFVLLCVVGVAFAFPNGLAAVVEEQPLQQLPDVLPVVLERAKRQLQLSGGGGGSRKQGFDISVDGRAPIWTSNNGRHEIGASAGYSQHLGGPYGNSRPDYRGGASYTFRF